MLGAFQPDGLSLHVPTSLLSVASPGSVVEELEFEIELLGSFGADVMEIAQVGG